MVKIWKFIIGPGEICNLIKISGRDVYVDARA